MEPLPVESDHSDDEWEDDEGDEVEGDEEPMSAETARCLFCDLTFRSPEAVFGHCQSCHGFDLAAYSRNVRLDCFGYIKMVNYCRTERPPAELLLKVTDCSSAPWRSDDFMKPVLDEDALLTYDIEDLPLEESRTAEAGAQPAVESEVKNGNAEDRALQERLSCAESRAMRAEESLEQLAGDILKMRELAQTLMSAVPEPAPSHQAVAKLQEDDDDFYFGSYAHFGIHHEMLQDTVRTTSYRDSLYLNADSLKDKVVLDIGCGTGILSMFAAKAGAKKVIGVDMSEIAYQAMDIVRENNLSDTITIIKGRMEDIDLPVEKVDVIISEWMGYFLLFESMLDSVLYARDRWLAPGGVVMPNRCNLTLVGLANHELRSRHLDYWQNVYGFKMSCMHKAVVQEASLCHVNNDTVCTDAAELKVIDISTCTTSDLEFTSPFCLTAQYDCELTVLIGYFDIWFDALPNSVHFSTGPGAHPTHWKQTVFLLEDSIPLKKGEVLKGQLICRKNRKDPRSLRITISLPGKTVTYHMQ